MKNTTRSYTSRYKYRVTPSADITLLQRIAELLQVVAYCILLYIAIVIVLI